MIKINLLNSVTERQGSAVMAVDRKVGSPGSRLLLLTLAVGFLLAAVIGWDVISTQMAKADAEHRHAAVEELAQRGEIVVNRPVIGEEEGAGGAGTTGPRHRAGGCRPWRAGHDGAHHVEVERPRAVLGRSRK